MAKEHDHSQGKMAEQPSPFLLKAEEICAIGCCLEAEELSEQTRQELHQLLSKRNQELIDIIVSSAEAEAREGPGDLLRRLGHEEAAQFEEYIAERNKRLERRHGNSASR